MRFTRLGKILENVLIVIFIIIIGVLIKSFYDNYSSLSNLNQFKGKLHEKIDKEKKEINHLKESANVTNSTIEKKTRGQYYMQKDNETVIIFKK
ncbi:septum formation initiator family protein [Desulfurella sp.]|uniref:septum formation initiator family protein n=1 Tax=Desulfurella sp. TaxID=1962857 RepID=UPI003D1115B6